MVGLQQSSIQTSKTEMFVLASFRADRGKATALIPPMQPSVKTLAMILTPLPNHRQQCQCQTLKGF